MSAVVGDKGLVFCLLFLTRAAHHSVCISSPDPEASGKGVTWKGPTLRVFTSGKR